MHIHNIMLPTTWIGNHNYNKTKTKYLGHTHKTHKCKYNN